MNIIKKKGVVFGIVTLFILVGAVSLYSALSVYISGPVKGNNSGTYTWCANVSSGQPPYTYSWEYFYGQSAHGYLGTSQCITVQLPLDFDVTYKVTVTDALGVKAYDYIDVMNTDAR